MRLSVIIPTHNRAASLRRTLKGLSKQALAKADFEIIVVDDGSEAAVRSAIKAFANAPPFQLLKKTHGGLASARNLGAERACGDLLLFLDDDVVPAPHTLKAHLDAHELAPKPQVVVGALPYPPDMWLNAFLWYLQKRAHFDLYTAGPRKYAGGLPPLPPLNGNASLLRSLFFDIGKYDESFIQYGGEDLDLGYRLAKAGVRFVYDPAAKGYHFHEKDFIRFCADMETAGESLIMVYRKHPEIKVAKKIDIMEDSLSRLSGKKRLLQLALAVTLRYSWLMLPPRFLALMGEPFWAVRYLLYPLFYGVSQYHYAKGMQKGLSKAK